jgi:hypothetical protein
MSDYKLQLSGDESTDMWEDIQNINNEKLRHALYNAMCHAQNAEYRLVSTLKALTERVKELEKRTISIMPLGPGSPIGDFKFGPVRNDGKPSDPNADVRCSFCGAEHEARNLYQGGDVSICRVCIAYAAKWKDEAQGGKEL